jgi:glycerate 2-kinase
MELLIYSPQKGADSKMVKELDMGLENFAAVIKREIGVYIKEVKGSGAAGGLGGGIVAFLNARIRNGINAVIEVTGIEENIKDDYLVITGEGAIDIQTFFGKGVYSVAKLAKKYNKQVININSSVLIEWNKTDKELSNLTDGNFSIIHRPMTLNNAVK